MVHVIPTPNQAINGRNSLMTTNAELPSISSYGRPHSFSNYGAHTLRVDLGSLTVWFSYRTLVAFRAPGMPTIVRQNDWGAATGTHLMWIDSETGETSQNRVSGEQFDELWARHVELQELTLLIQPRDGVG